jgi:hypothetical protein
MSKEKPPDSQSAHSDQESSRAESASANRSVNSIEQSETRTRVKPRIRLRDIYNHPVVVFLSALAIGFTAGIATFKGALELTDRETVPKGSYVLKRDLTGTILRNEAVQRIDNLIDIGGKLSNDEETTVWLLQVLTFVQYINLEKNTSDEQGQKISAVEANIRYALKDPKIKVQAQKTLGVLKGLRSALAAQKDVP